MEAPVCSATIKRTLRRELQAARQGLPASDRARLDLRICAHLVRGLEQSAGLKLSAYFACRGEPDLGPALAALHEAEHCVHLPVLVEQTLQFRRWHPNARMTANRYRIPEPLEGETCPADQLDWVLLPLVAFSPLGGRLGMGGGYYDRTFSFCLQRSMDERPRLIGVAYGLQQVDSLPLQRWDVPLDGVVTEQGLRWFERPDR